MNRIVSFVCLMSAALSLLLFLAPGQARAQFSLNDVSVLMPLPLDPSEDTLLRARNQGVELVPWDAFRKTPPLFTAGPREQEYDLLRAVGIRIDHCFPELTEVSTRCARQVRIVWQPIVFNSSGARTIDAAIHTFYELTEAEFAQLTRDLLTLKAAHSDGRETTRLGVHPIAARQGLRGPFVTTFHQIILRAIGPRNTTRMTFMTVRGNSILWNFGGFELDRKHSFVRMVIPRLSFNDEQERFIQTFVAQPAAGEDFRNTRIAPAPTGTDTFEGLLEIPDFGRPTSEGAILDSVKAAARIEHPDNHNPNTVDCVSCHIAQPAKHFAFRKFKALPTQAEYARSAYRSTKFDLTNTSRLQDNIQVLRAFGYFDREPAFNQRTINESAAIADALNSRP